MIKFVVITTLIGIIWIFALTVVLAMLHDLFRGIEKAMQRYSKDRPEYWNALRRLKRRVGLIVGLWLAGVVYIFGYTVLRWHHQYAEVYHKVTTTTKHNLLHVRKYECIDIPLSLDYCRTIDERAYDISHYIKNGETDNVRWCQEKDEHN